MPNKSRYAEKRASGHMMYGPGCCGHSIPDAKIQAAKAAGELARRAERADARRSRALEALNALGGAE